MVVLTSYIKAIFSRVLYIAHASFTIWRLVVFREDEIWWLLSLCYVALIIETIITLVRRQGYDTKWFIPSVLLYIACEVIPIWFIEIDALGAFRSENDTTVITLNGTNGTIQCEVIEETEQDTLIVLDTGLWVLTLEQTFLFVLIISRWFMPSKSTSEDELSQLLFIYIGVMSDIMEILLLFDELEIRNQPGMPEVVMAIWTVSLLQFCFVQTSTQDPEKKGCCRCWCCQSEVWSLVLSLCVQDIPFIVLRLFAIVHLGVMNYTILFFTCKNALVITLQIYRIAVLFRDKRRAEAAAKPPSADAQSAYDDVVVLDRWGNSVEMRNRTESQEQSQGHINAAYEFSYARDAGSPAGTDGAVKSVTSTHYRIYLREIGTQTPPSHGIGHAHDSVL